MAFRPQNPFEFVEQLLGQATQQLTAGFGRGQEKLEAGRADRGRIAQQYGLQMLPELRQLAGVIGDDNPELVRALGSLASEIERGILADPSKAAEIIGQARASVERRESGVMEYEAPLFGPGGAATLRERGLGRDTATRELPFETVVREDFSPQELIGYAMGEAGALERARALTNAERQNQISMEFEEFKNQLIMYRERTKSNYDFGLSLQRDANERLAKILPLLDMLTPDELAQYESMIAGLQVIATSTPQQVFSIYEQAMRGGNDIFLALSTIAGLATSLTDRQVRIRDRFNNLVSRIEDPDFAATDVALATLREAESFLPPGTISAEELSLVRTALGVERAIYTPQYYRDNPQTMAGALSAYYDPRTGLIDTNELQARNKSLFDVYVADRGVAETALKALIMNQNMANRSYAFAVVGDAREVLNTGVGYDALPPEGKAEVKMALGNPTMSDSVAQRELTERAQSAAAAARAAREVQIAQDRIRATTLVDEQLTNWALEGNFGALIAYVNANPSLVDDSIISGLIRDAMDVYDNKVAMVSSDADLRRGQADEALRKARNGRALNALEVAALEARFKLDTQEAIQGLATLSLRTYGDVANVLTAVAEAVLPEFWTDEALPPVLATAVKDSNLLPSLIALSSATAATNSSKVRSEARDLFLDFFKAVPDNREAALEAATAQLLEAGYSPGLVAGFGSLLSGQWDRLGADASRAEDQLDLNFARFWLEATSALAGNNIGDSIQLINLVNSSVDNQRANLVTQHASLIQVNCAAPNSSVFGGPTLLKPENIINAGDYEGQSCSMLTDVFLKKKDDYDTTLNWHTRLVESVIDGLEPGSDSRQQLEALMAGLPTGRGVELAAPFMGGAAGSPVPPVGREPARIQLETAIETMVPTPDLRIASFATNNWENNWTAGTISRKSDAQLLQDAAALYDLGSGSAGSQAQRDRANLAFGRIRYEIQERFGWGENELRNAIVRILNNR